MSFNWLIFCSAFDYYIYFNYQIQGVFLQKEQAKYSSMDYIRRNGTMGENKAFNNLKDQFYQDTKRDTSTLYKSEKNSHLF